MEEHLVTADGRHLDPTPDVLASLLGAGARFWLDVGGIDRAGAESLLRGTFGFHPLAVEDAAQFGQRPKLDAYDDFSLLVVYGVSPSGDLVEVHCFYTDAFLVTVHRDPCPELGALADRLVRRAGARGDHVMLLYRVVDTLVDGFFPVLARFDDEIDALEDEILERPSDDQLGRLFDMKRSLIAIRKVVAPERDMFASLLTDTDALAGMTREAERYFRALYDHLIRIGDLVDSYRDLLTGALDTHLSTVSNRLNVVMKQLTIIATVFLPLSFLTGFFGQNFGWLVGHLGSAAVFGLLGVGLQVAVVIALVVLFRRRGWLSADGSVPAAAAARRRAVPRARRWHAVHPRPGA